MKRIVSACVTASLLAVGCGGPKATEPKAVNAKQDPRIQRAAPVGGAAQKTGAFGAPKGKVME